MFALCAALLLAPSGCATHVDRLREVRSEYYAGNMELATANIQKHLKRYPREADAFKLDQAIVDLSAGRPREAEQLLREVRDSLDYLQQGSAAETVASMLTDDTVKAYPGEDYERVLLRVFLSLANLMNDGGDATAYSLQAADLQEQIIRTGTDERGENPKLTYKRVAMAAYLSGMLREETHANYDDVARAAARVVSWEPAFAYGRYDLERAQRGRHSARGNGVLYVFALMGRGPYKEEKAEVPSTVSLLVADRILSATTKHTLPPTIAPVKVPLVVAPANGPGYVQVAVNRQPVGATATITHVAQLAAQQYEAVYPRVIARAVVRRVVKKGIVYAGKEVTHTNNGSWTNLLADVAGVAWEATESADTRCWGLLPEQIQVLRIELPAGQHQVSLTPLGHWGPPGGEQTATVKIDDGRNTYVLASFADGRLLGRISVGPRGNALPPQSASGVVTASAPPAPRK